MLETGDRLLIAHRRLFADDHPRFFVGTVESYDAGVVLVAGHSWVRDPFSGDCVRKPDLRTKVISLVSGSILVYRLPRDLNVDELRMEHGGDNELVLTDGDKLHMDLTERVPRRRVA